jgi:hypothetical protein
MNILCKFFRLFHKEPEKSWVRFYSMEPGVPEVHPIVPTSKIKRAWQLMKQEPDPDNGPMFTKNCPGIKKLLGAGYTIVAPADFIISTNGDGVTFRWAEARKFSRTTPGWENYIGFHNRHQTELVLDNPDITLKTAVKIDTPWRVQASDDVVLLQLPVNYNNESRFTAATGVFDPRFGYVVNVQLFWHVLEGETLVKAGTPLCQYIPMKRESLNPNIWNVTVDTAGPEDIEREKRFNYATSCSFIPHDNVGSRLRRVTRAIKKVN